MIEIERQRLIHKLVQERSVMSVASLAVILGSSKATVRRDLRVMAAQRRIRRIRGGAEALTTRGEAQPIGVSAQSIQGTGAALHEWAIARAAAALISDGDSLIINGGTTTLHLTEFLENRALDVLTNSIAIAMRLLAAGRCRVTVPGGTIHREQNVILSPYDDDALEHFWGKKLLTSCYGLSRFGMMEADPLIVQAGTKLLRRAEELIVLAESSKLRQRASMVVAPLERISTLVTDCGAEEEELKPFRLAGIRVICAEPKLKPKADKVLRRGAAI